MTRLPPPTRPRALRACPPILALCLPLAGCGDESALPRTPNVLLVSIDTLRADHLGCYGYERDTTPHLDRLAREGVLFEDCTSTTSWTLPAHLSLFTGLPVSGHGVCDDRLWSRSDGEGDALEVPLHGEFLSELLQRAGYRTGGFYTWKYLEPKFGFGPGFEVYERLGHTFYSYPPVARRFEELRALDDVDGLRTLAAEYPELFDSMRQSSPETIDRALEWIDGVRDETPREPFFCFVHLFDVHDPYTPPEPFNSRFTDPAYEGEIDGRNVTSPDSAVRPDMPEADLRQLIALYDGGIAWVDSEIGRLLAALEERGLAEDTVVVITSDHGEEFFEHGRKTHRHALHPESVNVPLLIRWPAELPAGRRVSGPVGLIDIAPTLSAICAAGKPAGAIGRDLTEIARGAPNLNPPNYLSELLVFEAGSVPRRLLGLRGEEGLELMEARGEALPSKPELKAALDEIRAARARTRLRAASEERGLTAGDRAELEAMGYTGSDLEDLAAAGGSQTSRLCAEGCVWPDAD